MAQKLHAARPHPRQTVEEDVSDGEFDSEEQIREETASEECDQHSDAESSDDESNGQQQYEQQISHLSFGALKQAQDVVSRKRKRGSDTTPDQEDKLAALRDRLRQIKEQKASKAPEAGKNRKGSKLELPAQADERSDEDSASDSDSDSAPSEGAPQKSRSSKHAPTAQSTKYQVSRKRQVVDVPKRNVRDPRFDAIHQRTSSGNPDKAYAFLVDYQKDEIKELRAEIKRTKNEEDKEILRRKVNSMENRLKAKAAKEREQEVLRRHRKEEKVRVEQGKTPYYLKKKELKEQALVEKFKGMKSKERQKLVEKRQKKESQKEKKRMPEARRMASG